MAARHQLMDQVRADEAGSASNEAVHVCRCGREHFVTEVNGYIYRIPRAAKTEIPTKS
jgi:hypothetical protein